MVCAVARNSLPCAICVCSCCPAVCMVVSMPEDGAPPPRQVSTKYGNVSTDHILFICSGAFHQCKPSDMLAELQGRLPIRVELKGLTCAPPAPAFVGVHARGGSSRTC